MQKKQFLLAAALLLSAFCRADEPKMKVYVDPAMIYDDARCSIYQDYMTDISFHFFYADQRIFDLKESGTKLFIELPEEIKAVEAGVMDRWKNPTEIRREFKTESKNIDGKRYVRYELPIPTSVLQPAIKKPLPGGMFGGTTNNLVRLLIKPEKELTGDSVIYWETVGKYPCRGQFSVYPVKLDLKGLEKSRIFIQSHTFLPGFAYSREAIAEQIRLFKDLKVDSVNTQLPSGPNRGEKEMWDKAGFKVYGGDSLMHVLWSDGKDEDELGHAEDRDYLTGINGVNGRHISRSAYHGRAFCPQAAVTPGRYPNRKLLRLGREAAKAGAAYLDIDIEADLCIMCYCPECLEAFFKFSGLKPEKLNPVELVEKYPEQWYRFRSEQTRLLYQALRDDLKKDYPNLKIGANTVLHEYDKDMSDLEFGVCGFAEDPRLMKGTLEFILADTLMGGLYDAVTVDAMSRSSKLPIIAIPGSSYCVGFSAGVMCGRRMTAEMTGDTYGYDQRFQFHKLGMLHLAANGAAGLRYAINEACVAKATVEAVKILKQAEDFYLDGKRADEKAAVADHTKGASRWLLDKSRVRGGIWRHFYDNWCGKVQSRTHELNGEYLVGLYNWDPFQTKKWHLSLKNIPDGDYYPVELISGKRITLNGKDFRTAAELKKGFVMEIPPADCRIIRFARKKSDFRGTVDLACEATDREPYNQYAWRSGKKIDMLKYMKKQMVRPLRLIKQFGNQTQGKDSNMKATTAVAAAAAVFTLSAMDFPYTADFSKTDKLPMSGKIENNALVSNGGYNFSTMQLPASEKNLMFTLKCSGKDGANLGLALYDMSVKKRKQLIVWGTPVNGTKDFTFLIPADNLKERSKLLFYNVGRKGTLAVTAMKIEQTDKTKLEQPKVSRQIPCVSVPFKADFSKKQAGFSFSGKIIDGKAVATNTYTFCTMNIPASKVPLSCSVTVTASEEATLGIVVYDVNEKGLPGKALIRAAWGKRLGQKGETTDIALPAFEKPRILMIYNVAKKGTLTLENIELDKME